MANKGYLTEHVIPIVIEYCNMVNLEIPCFKGKTYNGCYKVCGNEEDRVKVEKRKTKESLEAYFKYLGYVPKYEEFIECLVKYFDREDEDRKNDILHTFFENEIVSAGGTHKADINVYGFNISIKCEGSKEGENTVKGWGKCKYTIINKTPVSDLLTKKVYLRKSNMYVDSLLSRMLKSEKIKSNYPFIEDKGYLKKLKLIFSKITKEMNDNNTSHHCMFNKRTKKYSFLYQIPKDFLTISPLIEYFLYEGTTTKDSFNPADCVLVCSNPFDIYTYKLYEDRRDYLLHIKDRLEIEYRGCEYDDIYYNGKNISLLNISKEKLEKYWCACIKGRRHNGFAIHVKTS